MAYPRDGAVLRVAKRRYWREADARVIVEAWRRSEASLSTVARRYGVHGKRIARWAPRLESPRSAVRFHPVRLVAAADSLPAGSRSDRGGAHRRRGSRWQRARLRSLVRTGLECATFCYICYNSLVPKSISQRELRNDSGAVLRRVQAGQTLVVTRNGTPVAELRPLPPRRFVPRDVIASAGSRAPRIDAARFRRDLDESVDQRVDG